MATFYTLKVKSVKRQTREAVSVTFEVPQDIKPHFRFVQGQHLTLRKRIGGEDIRRSYSLCSCPLEDELSIAIKRVEGGIFSTYANTLLSEGEEIEALPPQGKFYVPLAEKNQKYYVAFASGSGITPIISILETTLRIEPKSHFVLFYGNKNTASIMFHDELEALKNRFMDRFSLYHILSQEKQAAELFEGRIDKEKVQKFSKAFYDPETTDHFFTCGPGQMTQEIKEALIKLGVPEKRIHLELFSAPQSGGVRASQQPPKPHQKATSRINVIIDGTHTSFPYDSRASILDVAQEEGVELPFACKGGVCSTCICKLQEGKVDMEVNYALTAEELEKGMILSCQAYPTTKEVTLNFDI